MTEQGWNILEQCSSLQVGQPSALPTSSPKICLSFCISNVAAYCLSIAPFVVHWRPWVSFYCFLIAHAQDVDIDRKPFHPSHASSDIYAL